MAPLRRVHTVEIWDRVRRALCSWVYAVFDDVVVELAILHLNELHSSAMAHTPARGSNNWAHQVAESCDT